MQFLTGPKPGGGGGTHVYWWYGDVPLWVWRSPFSDPDVRPLDPRYEASLFPNYTQRCTPRVSSYPSATVLEFPYKTFLKGSENTMKLNMDSITYDNGNGGIEFLEKCLKLTQIPGYLSVDDGPRWWFCVQSLAGCCRKSVRETCSWGGAPSWATPVPLKSNPRAPLMRRLHTSQQYNTKIKKDWEFA